MCQALEENSSSHVVNKEVVGLGWVGLEIMYKQGGGERDVRQDETM